MQANTIIDKIREVVDLETIHEGINVPISVDRNDQYYEGGGVGAKVPTQFICNLGLHEIYQTLLKSPYIGFKSILMNDQILISSFPISSEGMSAYFNSRFVRLSKNSCVFVGYVGDYYRTNSI